MNTFAALSYGTAAIGFGTLTLLLVTGWQGKRQGGWPIVVCAVTAGWAAWLALADLRSTPLLALYMAEAVRNCAWILTLLAIGGRTMPRLLTYVARAICAALLLASFVVSKFVFWMDAESLLAHAGLATALLALILVEQIYRNATPSSRQSLKYLAIGAGVIFAYDLFLYSQAELLAGVTADAWNARGLANAIAVPLIVIAARRNTEWSLDIFVSRQVVFHTGAFMVVGAYLVVMAAGGYYVREIGGAWGRVGQIVFLAGAAVALLVLLASNALRRHAWVFISKHFYRNKYDYRIEWLRFIRTLSSAGEEDVRRISVRAVAQIFANPGGVLFTLDDSEQTFIPVAAWPMRIDAIPDIDAIDHRQDLPSFLARTHWIIDLKEYQRAPDLYGNIALPVWLKNNPHLRIVSPLLQLDRLVGFFVLYEPPSPFALTYEDRDLLKTVGGHVATHLAQHEADRKLAESKQFEAYNRLTAFMMHDLKNSVAQLNLLVSNAERHKRNPDFIDDAIGTIANAADRMSRLIEQLAGKPTAVTSRSVSLADLTARAVARCSERRPAPVLESSAGPLWVSAHGERLATVIEHVIRNAQDATPENGTVSVKLTSQDNEAVLVIADSGSGMDAEFIRQRLFRPFDSTKGPKGMGIGAYQAREYVHSLGGRVEVQSNPGIGTQFSISLPVLPVETADIAVR
jgi:putative PEP-CTERM system histidine kinase